MNNEIKNRRIKEAIKLVELRGQLMQEAVPAGTGAMYAIIGLDDEAIAKAETLK